MSTATTERTIIFKGGSGVDEGMPETPFINTIPVNGNDVFVERTDLLLHRLNIAIYHAEFFVLDEA